MNQVDMDNLARHLIREWGVKPESLTDELVPVVAQDTLRQAAAELAALRARVDVLTAEEWETIGQRVNDSDWDMSQMFDVWEILKKLHEARAALELERREAESRTGVLGG